MRWGTSRGFSSREKLLRVTGAALERAKSATPRTVRGTLKRARAMGWRTQKSARPGKIARAIPRPQIWLCDWGASRERETSALFELDRRACLLEFGFEFLALLAVDALFDRAGSGVDDGLRLFQTEAGRVADHFDDRDFLAPDLGDHDVDGGGLFGPTGLVATATGGSGRGGGGDR